MTGQAKLKLIHKSKLILKNYLKQTKILLLKMRDILAQLLSSKMSIDTEDHPPIAKTPYTLAIKHHEWVKEEIDKLLEAGVIRENHSSWSAPIVVVPKGDGGKRMCIDYRALNAIYRTCIWLMPRIDDILAKLGKANFSQLRFKVRLPPHSPGKGCH